MFRKSFQRLINAAGESWAQDRIFKARSVDRDGETDQRRIAKVLSALGAAITEAENERSGLERRVGDALQRAAVTMGNDSDEYLEREPLDDRHQSLLSVQISNGERRLTELNEVVLHFDLVKTATLGRFQQLAPSST